MLTAVVEASHALLAERDLQRGLQAAIAIMGERLGLDRVYVVQRVRSEAKSVLLAEWTSCSTIRWSSFHDRLELPDADYRDMLALLDHGLIYRSVHSDRTGQYMELNEHTGSKSDLIVPVRVREQIWGVLGFDDCQTERQWTNSEIDVLRAIAASVASAVERAETEQAHAEAIAAEREKAAQERTAELVKANDALQATIDALGEVTSLDQIVPRVLKIVADTFGANSCALYTHQPSGKAWLRYWFWNGNTLLPEDLVRLDQEKFATVRQLAEGFDVPDAYLGAPAFTVIGPVVLDHLIGTAVPEFDAFAVGTDWELELNLGVARGGVRVFTLCIYRKRTNPFTASEIALAEALTKQLSLALETSRLAEEARAAAVVREQEKAAQQRAAELERINRLLRESSQALARARTPQDIFEVFLVHAVNAMGATSGLLKRIEDTEHEFLALVREGSVVPQPLWQEEQIIVESRDDTRRDPLGVIQSLISGEDRWILVDDNFERWALGAAEFHRRAGNQAMLLWPFQNAGEVVGYIGIGFTHTTVPSQTQRETLKALSSQASLALELNSMAAQVEQSAIIREQEKAAQQRAAELIKANEAMKRTGSGLLRASDPDAILSLILVEACRTIGALDGAIFEYRPDRQDLIILCAVDNGKPRPTLSGYPYGDSTHPVPIAEFPGWQELIARSQPAFVHLESRYLAPITLEWHRHRGHRLVLMSALVIDGELLGSFGVAFGDERTLSPTELELFNTLAQQATLALQMARLSENAKSQAAETAILEERNRIAREIHDTLAQGFTGVLMQLQTVDQAIQSHDEQRAYSHLEHAGRIARDSLAEARRSVRALRPAELDAGSLSDALQMVARLAEGQSGISVVVDCDAAVHFHPAHAPELLRIAQEAITNAIKHAQAQRIEVRCSFTDGTQKLTISDNGKGFRPEGKTDGFGLVGMKERATKLGGTLRIESGPQGTSVCVSVPRETMR